MFVCVDVCMVTSGGHWSAPLPSFVFYCQLFTFLLVPNIGFKDFDDDGTVVDHLLPGWWRKRTLQVQHIDALLYHPSIPTLPETQILPVWCFPRPPPPSNDILSAKGIVFSYCSYCSSYTTFYLHALWLTKMLLLSPRLLFQLSRSAGGNVATQSDL